MHNTKALALVLYCDFARGTAEDAQYSVHYEGAIVKQKGLI